MTATTETRTFRQWLRGHAVDASDIGDLARDLDRDRGFPENPSPQEALEYLRSVAPPPVVDTMRKAIRKYQREGGK